MVRFCRVDVCLIQQIRRFKSRRDIYSCLKGIGQDGKLGGLHFRWSLVEMDEDEWLV
jgi:hypothetical protein